MCTCALVAWCWTKAAVAPSPPLTLNMPAPQVMYDASGVRLHAGRVLNMIITELPHPTLTVCTSALQVMYDASGVRLHAGRQASVLNGP